jgi:cytochrome o ubiquinol oxidase operon protein cyoD
MSIESDANLDQELHAHGDTHGHGSMRSYLLGFALSVVLTAIPFWLVMAGPPVTMAVAATIIIAFAAVQILVHTVCFLHVTSQAEGGWTLMAYIFTAILLIITIAGSLWIMYHLNSNMMPGMTPGQFTETP